MLLASVVRKENQKVGKGKFYPEQVIVELVGVK